MRPPHLALWAKLGQVTYPEVYHPLLFHLIDVAVVARRLWEDVLRPPMKEQFAAAVGVPLEACPSWTAFWSGAHDIGKASPGFQELPNSSDLVTHLRRQGFNFPPGKPLPHQTVSAAILSKYLEAQGCPWKTAQRIALAVGGHHGTFPAPGWHELSPHHLGNNRWEEAREAILDCLATVVELSPIAPPTSGDGLDQSYLMVLAGLTAVADWIGSSQAFFPPMGNRGNYLDDKEERVRGYFQQAERQARRALSSLGWTNRSKPSGDRPGFEQLFAYLGLDQVRPLQIAADRLASELDRPTLVLIEAPMGEGKTEAALCLADAWERRGGQGMYLALPTMATSNGMFARFGPFLEATYPGRLNLQLLHGQALLSPAYQALLDRANTFHYNALLYDDDKAPGSVVAEAWFARDKKQGLLAPYAVGTIDQALLAVLQVRHGFVRLFGLAGKVVVLDEVHAYDVYMTTLMEQLLRWLAALGCSVVLLSATLPRSRRRDLVAAYAGGPLQTAEEDQPYPRITMVRRGDPCAAVEHVPAQSEKTIHFEWRSNDPGALAEDLKVALAGGGCAVVIRNTVGQAQATFQVLQNRLDLDVKVELFHARFLFGRRQDIEIGVLRDYGKDRTHRPHKAVLVATQVVEQSLDLDFDLMVTDVAPIDLVLQRAGRLWRHKQSAPRQLQRPTVWLLRPDVKGDGVPDFGAMEKVYDLLLLLRSYLVLEQRKEVQLPADVEGLIEAVYGDDGPAIPSGQPWQQALVEANAERQQMEEEYRTAARTCMIPQPVGKNEILDHQQQGLEEEDPEVHPKLRAATRLGEPSVQLVVLYEINGVLHLDAAGTQPVNLDEPLTLEAAKGLLQSSVSISHRGCFHHYIRTTPPRSWDKSGLLRYHRLVRVDRNGVSIPCEHPLSVDSILGVRFSRERE